MQRKKLLIISAYFILALFTIVSFISIYRSVIYEFSINKKNDPTSVHQSSDTKDSLIGGQESASNSAQKTPIDINWESIYPFSFNPYKTQREEPCKTLFIKKIIHKFEHIKDQMSSVFKKMIPFYYDIIMCNNKIEEFIGWNISNHSEYNRMMNLGNNYFSNISSYDLDPQASEYIANLKDFCSDQNSRFLYILAPSKIDPVTDSLISGKIDFSNEIRNELFDNLREKNVDYLDLRENIRSQDLDTHSLFFETDHHWKPETGIWASSIIAQFINNNYDGKINLDLFNPDMYRRDVYKGKFLGSLGKKATLSVAKPEDISFFYPSYDTLINFSVPSLGIDETGDFSISYDKNAMIVNDLMQDDPYEAYAHGNKALVKFHNYMDVDSLNVLIIKDSFGNVVTPFLAQGVTNMDVLDLREFTGSVQTYIKENKPDIVIVIYTTVPSVINWDSHKDLYDFR